MGYSFKYGNVKLPLPLRFAVPLAIFLAVGTLLRAQEKTADTPPPLQTPKPSTTGEDEAIPPNVIISSGPVTATPKPAEKAVPPPAVQAGEERTTPGFLGAMSCSSSLCHGSGGGERNAYTIWARSDPHRHAAATLAGTRAQGIARGVSLASAAGSSRCTECHMPLATLPAERLAAGVDTRTEGVSCESCHGPAQNWIRSHTRRDFSHAQNAQTGVREERGLYERAGTCVACHQVLAPALLKAGHPALSFEMDAQMTAEPRHWIDQGEFFGPQAWLTGQAVAWRELSWALRETTEPLPEVREQWRALLWVLQRTIEAYGKEGRRGDLPGLDMVPGAGDFTPDSVALAQAKADELARAAARLVWTRASTQRCLTALAATDKEFSSPAGDEPPLGLRSRANRLASALSRLAAPLQKQDPAKWAEGSKELDQMAASTGEGVVFSGAAFGEQLRRFRETVATNGN